MKKNSIVYLGLVIILIVISFFETGGKNLTKYSLPEGVLTDKQSSEIPKTGEFYKVLRVVDGDTFIVDILDEEVRVRLIGIDTPESVDPNSKVECFGKEASLEAKKVLEGRRVRFETDESQYKYDKFGRLLAYVWTEDETFFNLYMIENGFAYEYTYLGIPYKYQIDFKNAKNKAKAEALGLWAPNVCNK